ncbi:hypothetical protein EX30DRAFT_395743 [Ascodesmis nigricans]|uniref:Uncharacterized protein n=1 Tax=Ascodesmis nigricans TaxID=341454 RepID=A0A4S2MXE7_9PEZI|nr:hypothetical protein EX30DRAFT_395743 [Ascodesmis nigricans]
MPPTSPIPSPPSSDTNLPPEPICPRAPSTTGYAVITLACNYCSYTRELRSNLTPTYLQQQYTRFCHYCLLSVSTPSPPSPNPDKPRSPNFAASNVYEKCPIQRAAKPPSWKITPVHRAPYRVCWACERVTKLVERTPMGEVVRVGEKCGCGSRWDGGSRVVWRDETMEMGMWLRVWSGGK